MMLWCWKLNPKDRPTFYDIIEELNPDMPESFRDNSFYFAQQFEGNDEDFASVGSVVMDTKSGCCDDENDDLDLIHSLTPLHATKSSLQNLSSSDCRFTEGNAKPDMLTSSRGLPMPFQLPRLADVVMPSSLSRSRISGSLSTLNEKTSLCDLDLNEARDSVIGRIASKPPRSKDSRVETTNDKLSCPDVKILSSGVVGGDIQPDVIRGRLRGSPILDRKRSIQRPHRNGLMSGILLPPNS